MPTLSNLAIRESALHRVSRYTRDITGMPSTAHSVRFTTTSMAKSFGKCKDCKSPIKERRYKLVGGNHLFRSIIGCSKVLAHTHTDSELDGIDFEFYKKEAHRLGMNHV